MFKNRSEIIVIQAEAKDPIPTKVVFWSHDKGTAKLIFELQKDRVGQPLAEGTIVPICLDFVGGRHIYHAVIEDALNGIVSIILEDNILGYQGKVDGSIYIELPDKRSLDTAGRFSFEIKRSPIDEEVPELEDYYWQGFNEIMESYHQTIAGIKSEAKELLDSLKQDVSSTQEKVSQLEQSISTANTNLNARIDEIRKKIDENDVYTKAESSANVINQIGGAESAILKKEYLVDGTEGTASRYVKDLPVNNNYALGTDTTKTMNGDGTRTITLNPLYRLSDKLLGKKVTISFDLTKAAGTTGKNIILATTSIYQNLFTIPLSEIPDSTTRHYEKTVTINTAENGQAIYLQTNPNEAPYLNGSVTVSNFKVEIGEATTPWSPAAEDYGIVHGQPNLLNGTSNEWVETTFSGWFAPNTRQLFTVGKDLNVGDTIYVEGDIDNSKNSLKAYIEIYVSNIDGTSIYNTSNMINAGSIGTVKRALTITSTMSTIRVTCVISEDGTSSKTISYKRFKMIKGTSAAMDEWTPSQADSGLTPINDGMVPFDEQDYEYLLSDDGIVRAETNVAGRGASIKFVFPVIDVIEQRYPYLFEGLTAAEKKAKYLSILKMVEMTQIGRGGGILTDGKVGNFEKPYIENLSGGFLALSSAANYTNNFVLLGGEWNTARKQLVQPDGSYIIYATSRIKDGSEIGALSDGVTNAWIEIKDIRLTIELEVNGRTIIESIVATYHRENLATQEEAESGESDEKLMTPLTTKQSIEKHSVLLQGDQDIDGIKNYLEMPTFEGKRFLTSDDLALLTPLWTGASFLSAAHTITLPKSVADCKTGIVLKFNPYNSTSGTAYTSQTSWWLIPKHHVLSSASGQNTFCPIFKQDGTLVGAKVVTVGPNKLTGADVNALGALYGYVLTGVYEA